MQTLVGACAPERLRALQKIFDAIWWVELLTGGRRPTAARRNEIAPGVAEHAGDVELKPDEISQAVLSALDAKPEPSLPTFMLTRFRPPRRG